MVVSAWVQFCSIRRYRPTERPFVKCGTSIRAFPAKAAVAKKHNLVHDVMAEAPSTEGKPILRLSVRHAFQFLDLVASRPVIGVHKQDRHQEWTPGQDCPP